MRLTLLILSACLTGCAAGAATPEQDTALHAWSQCIWQQVSKLDDGRSDPISVAVGVQPVCAGLYQSYSSMVLTGVWTEHAHVAVTQHLRDEEMRNIVNAVLTHRANARS